ncbi:gp40 [Burkholderia phage BcepC6B]|uniref:Gp40 n=1 Tax=Burkholderia phage BcepC6B TaxID=2883949 RepID=Q6J1N7_9CAUD|nr:hypothetical protein BcepC6B_gp40 [Burkholderia phage BcepC6B]AAT38399.1 gp40 [Burkholderia phage BcepC6B]
MKLTNIDRDVFVKAVMDDVPHVDHQEQARVAIQRKAVELLPPKLRVLYKEFGHWLKHERLWNLPRGIGTINIVSHDDDVTRKQMEADTEFWQSIEKMGADHDAQEKARDALKQKVRGVIYACTTAKQAHERLPEFAKYLPPPDAAVDRTVPVIANLVADLTAAGWPKGKKPAARKAVRK